MIDQARWTRVKTIFDRAVELSSAEREDYVRESCGSDSELQAELKSLLVAYDRGKEFLETPALIDSAGVLAAQIPDPRIGHEIGPYRVVRRVGEGGMGVVYEAMRVDGQFQQRVAIKLVKRGMDSEYILRRFRNERQILAGLAHPNIAKLFDGGVGTDGSPYFVMEYIEGELIDQYARTNSLDIFKRVELLQRICNAVAYAHRRQIIHRDIKPGNIMVDAQGTPKLLDFGIAKLVATDDGDGSQRTMTELVIITPDYASPEQARGEAASKRSDIYALGIVLYELTSGCRPNTISEGSALRCLPSDLQLIIRRATHQEAERRYANVDDLAADLQRFLSRQSVSARPDSLSYRLSRHIAQQSRIAWTASLCLVAIVAAILSWFIQKGPVLFSGPRPSVAVVEFQNTMGTPAAAWLSTALTEMLTTEISAGEKIRTIPGDSVARMTLDLGLKPAGSYSLPALRRIAANLHPDYVVVGSYLATGDKSDMLLRVDLRLQDTKTGDSLLNWTDTGTPGELAALATRAGAKLRQVLGVSSTATSPSAEFRNPESGRLYAEGLEHMRSFDPLGARARLERAVAENPANPLAHAALASALGQLGYEERATEEARQALDESAGLSPRQKLEVEAAYYKMRREWSRAADTYRKLWTKFPDDFDYGIEKAIVESKAGDVAAARLTVAQIRRVPLADTDPRVDLAEALAADTAGDSTQELHLGERASAKARRMGAHQFLAEALYYQGWAQWLLGDLQGAERTYEEALSLFAEAGNQMRVVDIKSGLASVLLDEGKVLESARILQEGLAIARKLGDRSLEGAVNNNLAQCWERMGQLKKARLAYEQSSEVDRELNQRPNLAISLANIGGVIQEQGDIALGCARLKEALAIARAIGRKSTIAISLASLGEGERAFGNLEEAWRLETESLAVAQEIGRKTSIASALLGQAAILRSQRKWQDSEAKYEEAKRVAKDASALSKLAEAQIEEAQLFADEGRLESGAKLARLSREEFQKENDGDGQALAEAILAEFFMEEGRKKEAQPLLLAARRHMKPGEVWLTRLEVEKAEALMAFALGKRASSLLILRRLSAEAEEKRMLEATWDLELLMAEIEPTASARARVREIKRQANAKSLLRIARLQPKLPH